MRHTPSAAADKVESRDTLAALMAAADPSILADALAEALAEELDTVAAAVQEARRAAAAARLRSLTRRAQLWRGSPTRGSPTRGSGAPARDGTLPRGKVTVSLPRVAAVVKGSAEGSTGGVSGTDTDPDLWPHRPQRGGDHLADVDPHSPAASDPPQAQRPRLRALAEPWGAAQLRPSSPSQLRPTWAPSGPHGQPADLRSSMQPRAGSQLRPAPRRPLSAERGRAPPAPPPPPSLEALGFGTSAPRGLEAISSSGRSSGRSRPPSRGSSADSRGRAASDSLGDARGAAADRRRGAMRHVPARDAASDAQPAAARAAAQRREQLRALAQEGDHLAAALQRQEMTPEAVVARCSAIAKEIARVSTSSSAVQNDRPRGSSPSGIGRY